MREIWFGALLALTLSGGLPAAAQAPKADQAKAASLLEPNSRDRVLGKADAPVTIVEYASLSCPHCAHFEKEVLPGIEKNWIEPGKAKLILRDFPLDERAMKAEMLARCVPPEKYYPLVKTLFATQEEWVLAKDGKAALERTAKLAGIPQKDVDACLANKKLEDEVAGSRLVANQQLGVQSTPTFFINGRKFEGAPTAEAFNQALSDAAGKS